MSSSGAMTEVGEGMCPGSRKQVMGELRRQCGPGRRELAKERRMVRAIGDQ